MASRIGITRQIIEDEIERLISMLDNADGDPDLEDDETDEQHDAEADITWPNDVQPNFYVIAETARRRGRLL